MTIKPSDENSAESNKWFFWEKERLESFVFWPFDEKKACNKAKMAEAGFYFSGSQGEPDIATCFACEKTLDGWEPHDDPWQEHIKHAPQCIFVQLGKPEEQLTVAQIYDLMEAVAKLKLQKKFQADKKKQDKVNEDLRKKIAQLIRT